MRNRGDYLDPYRESAPSRQRITDPSGPFTPARAKTDAGMLSALIFRGITFGTDFLLEYPTFFNIIDHFHEVKDAATQAYISKYGETPPIKYFCLGDAYGPHNHRRQVALADTYAAALEKDSWAAKFQTTSRIPFLACFKWLDGCLPGLHGKGNGPKRFPVLGPLGSYLLAADMVYAGAVNSPTATDMGWIIWRLNKGAASGLELLRLIPARTKLKKGYSPAKEADCKRAFKRLFDKMQSRIPEDNRSDFNHIILEHGLCKFSRSVKKNWFKLYRKK
ncbi:hypothetical protein C8R45DRAFT_836486 [Mycena sanguinolenta]|nr:hypothetical protein C8R45DRAFT_836486 [Mycena sanguinolenta]